MRFQFAKNSRLWLFTNWPYRPVWSVIVRDYARWWELSDQSASLAGSHHNYPIRPQTPMSLSRDDVQCDHLDSPWLTQAVAAGRDLLVVAITILPSPTFNPSLGTLSSQDSQALRTVDWHWHHCYKVSYQNIFNGSKLGNLSDKDFCKYIFVVCW